MFLLSARKAAALSFVDVSFIESFGLGLQTFALISHILHNAMCAWLTRYCFHSLYLFHMHNIYPAHILPRIHYHPPPSVGYGRVNTLEVHTFLPNGDIMILLLLSQRMSLNHHSAWQQGFFPTITSGTLPHVCLSQNKHHQWYFSHEQIHT